MYAKAFSSISIKFDYCGKIKLENHVLSNMTYVYVQSSWRFSVYI